MLRRSSIQRGWMRMPEGICNLLVWGFGLRMLGIQHDGYFAIEEVTSPDAAVLLPALPSIRAFPDASPFGVVQHPGLGTSL